MTSDDNNLSNIGVFKKAAHKLYVEYLERSITHGLRMIRRTEGDSYGRYIWLGCLALTFIFTHMNVYNLAIEFMQAPTEIRLSPKVVHVKHVLFPAIAICSNNKISKKALKEFAENLFEFQELHYPRLAANSSTELADKLLAFSGFFLHPFDENIIIDEHLQKLNDLLVHKYDNSSSYPTLGILRALAPKCNDIVLRCEIRDQLVNCSDIFFMRTTTAGLCCLFNYRRNPFNNVGNGLYERNQNASMVSNKTLFSLGQIREVKVVLQDDTSDHTLKEYACESFVVMIFYPDDYADAEKGSIAKVFLGYNEEYEISIQPDILEGSPRMRQFSSKMRHCYFLEEGQELLKQHYYSFNECMLDCRARSVVNYCGCMAPMLPGYIPNSPYCVLLDLPCVSLWKTIWWQWNSFDYVLENKHSQATMELCKQCLPSCDVISYKLTVDSRQLNIPENNANFSVGILQGIPSTKSTTVVRFFYKSLFSQVKTHDISGDWVVLLARYGGICSIMYGFSFVGIIELIYFLTGKWFVLWWKSLGQCYKNWLRRKVNHAPEQELYWNELKPKIDFPMRYE